MVLKKEKDNELVVLSVPTKKINLEITDSEKIEIVLRPFKQRHFAEAIAIINKYFEQFNSVRTDYVDRRKAILDRYEDEKIRAVALAELDAGFNEGMEIAKAILASGEEVSDDIKTIIQMSIYKATMVVTQDNGTERTTYDPELDDLTWGECLVLLGSTVGLNMDFFAQNSKAMNLMQVISEPSPKPKPKAGAKSSLDSSDLTTPPKQ